MDTILFVTEKVLTFSGGWVVKALWERYTKREERKDTLDDTLRNTAKQLVEEMTRDLRTEVKELRQELKESEGREMECHRKNAELEARILILENVNGLGPRTP